MSALDLSVATDACRAVCQRDAVELALPGDPRREAVVLAMGAWHKLRRGGSGWDVDYARQHVSVAVPSIGLARDLLSLIPVVGGVFRLLPDHPVIFLAPSALADAPTLIGTVGHELGHEAQARRGELLWCIAYGVAPEARAAAEASCYGQDITARVLLGGADPDALADACEESLKRYDLDDAAMVTARGLVSVARRSLKARAPMGGPVVRIIRELEARGVDLPEEARGT